MNQDSGQALLRRNAELEAEVARLRRALESAKQNTTRLEAKLGRAEARGRAELASMHAMVAAAQASGSATRKSWSTKPRRRPVAPRSKGAPSWRRRGRWSASCASRSPPGT